MKHDILEKLAEKNGGKPSKLNPDGESSSKNVKRPKRGEANYLPNLSDDSELP